MNNELEEIEVEKEDEKDDLTVNPESMTSPTLQRLIKEVFYEEREYISCYNRMHNRHNRSR